ncbi:hypothetical protein PACTADRAFT_500 [Pachysolen tannophilus NRRL Y-2460]|uniref:Peptidase S8/S53 domain-containing protein n=1 Tax=Pachysolen tannophilus NRRL Y-2460 TaxID=669874 RepID=A0A1E4U282_PACTA|nr:hypothetical protein PACTADRAFT_500 [Pachysolen tannophilus NRRL Y-2460]
MFIRIPDFWVLTLFFLQLVSVNGIKLILELNTGETFSNFVSKYDQFLGSTKLKTQNIGFETISIGQFKAIKGDFGINLLKSAYFDKNIKSITFDRRLELLQVQSFAPKHLARLSQRQKLKGFQEFEYVYDSAAAIGVDIYIFDTGIYRDHPDFSGRVRKGGNFVINDASGESKLLQDPNGHGTAVAGVIGSETFGIAKKANLIDYKVVNKKGYTHVSTILKALNSAVLEIEETKRPSVIVLALGMSQKTHLLNHAIEAVVERGIAVVTGAGNSNQNACELTPASVNGVLTVGAIDINDSDHISEFSNWGACVDIFASGVDVPTLASDAHPNAEKSVVLKSGTSMSAGIAAGLVSYFMGMNDTATEAIKRTKMYGTNGAIPQNDFLFRPFTPNKVLFNCGGDPLW